MAKQQTQGMRMGPITLVTVISVLLLAVLAVLCIATGNATQTMAQRHAEATAETYAIDACGQAMVAGISDAAQGAGSGAAAATNVATRIEPIKENAQQQSGASDLTINVAVDGSTVSFTVSAESGKTLSARTTIADGGAVSINEWKVSSTQESEEETLWSGTQANQ